MREPLRDRERLLHIKEAIERIKSGTLANQEWLVENSLEYFGLVKLIEIIGEAVYKITPTFKEQHIETPWKQIEKMRHVLVHGYYTVGVEFIKEVVKTDLPILEAQIEQYLKEYFQSLGICDFCTTHIS